jgi:hypothetical protein
MIFISHSSKDKSDARRLLEVLAREGLPAWLDENQLFFGDTLSKEIEDAISKSDVFLYLISKDANSSVWVQRELNLAISYEIKQKLKVIPVRLTGDDLPLPESLNDRLYHALDVNAGTGGGVNRLALELKAIASPTIPDGCRVAATVRLLQTGIIHTLDEVRSETPDALIDVLFLNDNYQRIDIDYWPLSEVRLPRDINGSQTDLENAARIIENIHDQNRRAITELRKLTRRYISQHSRASYRQYYKAGYIQTMRVILHRLAWNCEYLYAIRDSHAIDSLIQKRDLLTPFNSHICDFFDGITIVKAHVPSHGHPFSGKRPEASGWGMTNPFADMLEDQVGACIGDSIARYFLAKTLSSAELLNPDKLLYGLA